MPLLNYTTSVAAEKTASEMQRLLAKAGAGSIMVNYAAGEPVGLVFMISTVAGPRTFSLPVDALKVEAVLHKQGVPNRYQGPAQAQRVAWRITKDWLEAQLAIVETDMVRLEQVMLPYMQAGDGRTVWQLFESQALALPGGG